MNIEQFDFTLPTELIAKKPVEPRDHSRLLVISKSNENLQHLHFYNLLELLNPEDLIVVNNTKVIAARLFAKSAEEREFEILLLEPLHENLLVWKCLVRPGKKVKNEIPLFFSDGVQGILKRNSENFTIHFSNIENFYSWLNKNGQMPIPPYMEREANIEDNKNYQTVYARHEGSVAAPTAGLHFTDSLLKKINEKAIQIGEVTLHVGYGTFSPIKVADITEHKMHKERYEIPVGTLNKIDTCKKNGGRVIAVGTTSLRTLESYPLYGKAGNTDIFISPGHQFKIVDGLITNFHLPRSSLLVLVSALLGIEKTKAAYQEAIQKKYRFYSYGDAMFIF